MSTQLNNGEQNICDIQLFSAGLLKFAVFAEEVAGVTEWKDPVPLPLAPPAILGIVAIRGRMLTVIDPRVLFKESGKTSPRHIIGLKGEEQLALAAERIEGQIKIHPEKIQKPEKTVIAVLGTVEHDGDTIRLLDISQLFASSIQGRERRRRQL